MAAEVEFHTGVEDPIGFACRLLRKAVRQGARLVCTGSRQTLGELDRALWVFEEREFVPHLRVEGAAVPALARTPIWLVEVVPATAGERILVNLGGGMPVLPTPHPRVIEIVSAAPDLAEAGRERWRHYKVAGLGVVHHPAAGG